MTKTYFGVDLSHWNKVTSFLQVKHAIGNDGFIILKAGGGDTSYTFQDPLFNDYYEQCKRYGIAVGAYYYSPKDMLSADHAEYAAQCFLKQLKGKQFEMPVFLDIENTDRKDKKAATDAAIVFCECLEHLNYFTGIYSSDISGFKERLQIERLSPYTLWVARYGKEPSYVRKYGIWQYTSAGSIAGIVGKVDLDISYKNYPKIIKGGKFNGYNT